MLTFDEAKKILNKEKEDYNDNEVEIILRLLQRFAELEIQHLKQKESDDRCDNLFESFH